MVEDLFEGFSTTELVDAIKAFARAKRGLIVQRAINDTGDIDILSEQQINVTHSFFKRVCLEWQDPIKNLVFKKEIKNKYKDFFLFHFFSLCSTQEEALVSLVMREVIFLKEEKIIISKRKNGVDVIFFVEKGRIKVNLGKLKLKKNLSFQELKFYKAQKTTFFLDENFT